jgi:YHS domain-containing protein
MRLAILLSALLTACTSMPPVPPPTASTQQCLVCRCRRDFDCLTVHPGTSTPRATYAGRTFYFCSDSCRQEFESSPSRYWPAK